MIFFEFFASIIAFVVALPFFWLLFAGLTVLMMACVVNEKGFLSTVSTAVLIALFIGKWEAIVLDPLLFAVGAVAYLAAGLLWSRYQWSRLLSKKFEEISRIRDNYLMESSLPLDYFKTIDPATANAVVKVPGEDDDEIEYGNNRGLKNKVGSSTTVLQSYVDYVTMKVGKRNIAYTGTVTTLQQFHAALAPTPSDNKGSIVMWITYWPVSSVWYIVKDIVADFHRAVYRMVAGRFQQMATEKFQQL